jgi:hypothetical protein
MSIKALIHDLEKNSNRILTRIAETSYGTPSHELWGVLGEIKSIAEENLIYTNLLKEEESLIAQPEEEI